MRVGIAVECTVCGRDKEPLGRSVAPAMAGGMCDFECPGYSKEPMPGSLWPGETEKEFGYFVGAAGTKEVPDVEGDD
jgi:hypothetical protein